MPPPVRRKLLASSWIVLALALVLAGAALGGNGGIAPPEPASPNADRIRDAYWLVLGITGAIFLLVEISLLLFIVRFRARGRPREVEGPQIRGHRNLELIWTAIPVLILIAIAGFVFYKLPGIQDVPEATAAGENLRVTVEGRQYYWRFVYPDGTVAVNELRVPVGRVVELELTAPAHDVIHSWWIPELGGKLDAIPGQTNVSWFQATRPGLYRGQCAEFCGAQHALMLGTVRALPEREYDAWLLQEGGAQREGRSTALGRLTYEGACAPCHGDRGQGLIGPPLEGTGLESREIEEIVQNGRGAMPPVGKGWDRRQLEELVTYVRGTFGRPSAGAPGGG
jgi:cytochrome c oxidase subunit 2